jgi:hypothetical protein
MEDGIGNTVFTKRDTLFGLNDKSEIYFLQGAESNKYEVVFGDGLFGRKPINGSTITVNYIVTNGSDGNGVDNFTLSDDLAATNGGTVNVNDITVVTNSENGANPGIIRIYKIFSAPRYFATQQRAVSSDDYASLVATSNLVDKLRMSSFMVVKNLNQNYMEE